MNNPISEEELKNLIEKHRTNAKNISTKEWGNGELYRFRVQIENSTADQYQKLLNSWNGQPEKLIT